MASNTLRRLAGPVALTTTYTTNIYNPPTATPGVGNVMVPYAVVRHVHVANKTATAATFRLYLGATAGNVAGSELFFDYSVAANSAFDWYGALRMDAADFLVGGAGTTTALTVTIEGEVGA